jgi:esterase
VTDQDAAEFARRKPGLAQYLVPHAGHSIQSDAPLELAAIGTVRSSVFSA